MEIKEALEILECNESMLFDDIKQSYRDLMQVWHPDRFLANNSRIQVKASEQTKRINQAFDVAKKHFDTDPIKTNKNDESYTIVKCVNCGTNNRIRMVTKNGIINCGKCGNNPYEKTKRNEEQPEIIIKCINCGTRNRLKKNLRENKKIICGRCGKNPYEKEQKNSSNYSKYDDIYKIFNKDMNKLKEEIDFKRFQKKKDTTKEDELQEIKYCAVQACCGKIQPDGYCNECGLTLVEGNNLESLKNR